MPITVTSFLLPSNPSEILISDIDSDSVDELIVVSRDEPLTRPPGITLHSFEVSPDGTVSKDQEYRLGRQAMFWDVNNGLWGIDGAGIVNLRDKKRIVSQPTWLQGLGATTPKRLEFVTDLDRDGQLELLWNSYGQIQVFSSDGRSWGAIASPSSGSIRDNTKSGGLMVEVSQRSSPYVITDINGDQLLDILLLDGDIAYAYLSAEKQIGHQSFKLNLPLNVQPQLSKESKELGQIQFKDINADGKIDMVWQYWVTDGSWFGASAEIQWAFGTGSGFGSVQKLSSESAVFDVTLEDIDLDGDLDLLLLETDLGLGSITKALLSKTGSLGLQLHLQEAGQFKQSEQPIASFDVPIDRSDAFDYNIQLDFNGDSRKDIISMEGTMLEILQSSDSGYTDHFSQDIGIRGDIILGCQEECSRSFFVIWSEDEKSAKIIQFH
jgi:hypothetical protein